MNRVERGGKDDKGSFGGPAAAVTDPIANNAKSAGEGIAGGAQGAANTVTEGAKGASGYLPSFLGGGSK